MNTITIIDTDMALSSRLQNYMRNVHLMHLQPGTSMLRELRIAQPRLVLLSGQLPSDDIVAYARCIRSDPSVPLARVIAVQGRWTPLEASSVATMVHEVVPNESDPALAKRLMSLVLHAWQRLPYEQEKRAKRVRVGRITVLADMYKVLVSDSGSRRLTAGEYRLLWMLASNAGSVMSVRQIAAFGVGVLEQPSERTIRARVVSLRRKLGPAASQLQNVRGSGYRLDP